MIKKDVKEHTEFLMKQARIFTNPNLFSYNFNKEQAKLDAEFWAIHNVETCKRYVKRQVLSFIEMSEDNLYELRIRALTDLEYRGEKFSGILRHLLDSIEFNNKVLIELENYK